MHVAVGMFSNRSQKTSNVVGILVTHSAIEFATFLFLPHFDSGQLKNT